MNLPFGEVFVSGPIDRIGVILYNASAEEWASVRKWIGSCESQIVCHRPAGQPRRPFFLGRSAIQPFSQLC
jgi:hypothetical protein